MKKLLTILTSLMLAATLVACTDAPENNDEDNGIGVQQEQEQQTPETPDENGEKDDVVVELPEADAENEPAEGTEEENAPALMPETEPETEVDAPATMPEVKVEDEIDTPAAKPEADVEADTPATLPEADAEADTPAVLPEEEKTEEKNEIKAEDNAPASDATIDDLYAIADKLYEGIDPENMPMVGTMELGEENFEYSAFVPYKSSYLAVESMPMMGSQPHSVVVVRAESAEEAASLAKEMEENANPRKWICVSARSVKSASKSNFAILVMTSVQVMPSDEISEEEAETKSNAQSEERANIIIDNFLKAVK